MKFSFNLTIDDWMAFQQYQKGKKTSFYSLAYPLIIGLGVALVAMNIYHIYMYGVSNVTWFSFIVLLGLIYILYIRKKALKRILEIGMDLQQKHPEAFGSMEMETDISGLNIKSEKAEKSVPWTDMDGFEENKHYFFLYSKKGVVYIVPKREMQDLSGFRAELTSNIE